MLHRRTFNPIEEARQYGIDITLLEERLQWSPTERLEHHSQMAQFVAELRRAGRINDFIPATHRNTHSK